MRTVPGRPYLTARLSRALGLDGNPLRRASDRAEAWIRAGLLAVFLTVGPVAAIAAGHWASHAGVPRASAQAHAVRAVLLQPASGPSGLAAAAFHAEVSAELSRLFSPLGSRDREHFRSTIAKIIARCGTSARADHR